MEKFLVTLCVLLDVLNVEQIKNTAIYYSKI